MIRASPTAHRETDITANRKKRFCVERIFLIATTVAITVLAVAIPYRRICGAINESITLNKEYAKNLTV